MKIEEKEYNTVTYLIFKNTERGLDVRNLPGKETEKMDSELDLLLEELFLEKSEEQEQRKEVAVRRKLNLSKIKSLNQTLQNLIQKKIRLDLEIKRTRAKLSKIKGQSDTSVKLSLQLEGLSPETLDPKDWEIFKESNAEACLESFEILKEIRFAQELLTEAAELPLFEE